MQQLKGVTDGSYIPGIMVVQDDFGKAFNVCWYSVLSHTLMAPKSS